LVELVWSAPTNLYEKFHVEEIRGIEARNGEWVVEVTYVGEVGLECQAQVFCGLLPRDILIAERFPKLLLKRDFFTLKLPRFQVRYVLPANTEELGITTMYKVDETWFITNVAIWSLSPEEFPLKPKPLPWWVLPAIIGGIALVVYLAKKR